jgi:hypothetical protein
MRKILFRVFCLCVPLMVAVGARGENTPAQLPEIVVSPLAEEERLGSYDQPEWTTQRRFPTTRVFVQQEPWTFGFEQWWRGRFYSDSETKQRWQEEFSVGLPHRVQVDIYENWAMNSRGGIRQDSVALEGRYALADWGKIPLNPTLYGEWKFVDEGSDVYELKILLGEEIAHGWHWGLNGIYEQEIEDAEETEYALSQALSRTLLDEKLSLGVEMKVALVSEEGTRSDAEEIFLMGPSVQWRPTAKTHIDLVPLFGMTEDSPDVESYVVLGIDFGGPKSAKGKSGRAPVSLQSN